MRRIRNPVWPSGHRGFESPPLRFNDERPSPLVRGVFRRRRRSCPILSECVNPRRHQQRALRSRGMNGAGRARDRLKSPLTSAGNWRTSNGLLTEVSGLFRLFDERIDTFYPYRILVRFSIFEVEFQAAVDGGKSQLLPGYLMFLEQLGFQAFFSYAIFPIN